MYLYICRDSWYYVQTHLSPRFTFQTTITTQQRARNQTLSILQILYDYVSEGIVAKKSIITIKDWYISTQSNILKKTFTEYVHE